MLVGKDEGCDGNLRRGSPSFTAALITSTPVPWRGDEEGGSTISDEPGRLRRPLQMLSTPQDVVQPHR